MLARATIIINCFPIRLHKSLNSLLCVFNADERAIDGNNWLRSIIFYLFLSLSLCPGTTVDSCYDSERDREISSRDMVHNI